ncbi:Serine/threonine protein kinase [Handroanthus impetiginosus]|uniref:Serine/threonine protein kinase n=1 Tax=Handroanthus impetiginosus TaxID=429701 RepID=A0A2G9HEA6_9LAMI|nr:Serine/threonine protein kinase [Handroanthus impetiginosus]
MNWILKIVITLIFYPTCIKSQQKYSGNSALRCDGIDEKNPSESILYTCNGEYLSCRTFLIFTAKFPYNTVPAIAALTSSDEADIVKLNNVTRFVVFPEEQEVIVPVNCSCSDQYYQANTTYQIPNEHKTYYTIANDTYQGLSTCKSLKRANSYSEWSLLPGQKLQVPLRCACPTREQVSTGTKFLLTYSIGRGDTPDALSKQFNLSVTRIREANGLSDKFTAIYPFTTILIPMLSEPSSSHAMIRAVAALSVVIILSLMLIFRLHKKPQQILHSPRDLILEIARFDRALRVFRFSEIKKATGNFGSKSKLNGSVYHGTFRKEVFAVKKKSRIAEKEVRLLHKLNHFNIVKLVGFCEHKDNLYLVYEYMKNGSLLEWLGRRGSDDLKGWIERFRIALDVANGLLYLHNFTNPAYVHNNISSSSILLDGNLRAKIANFSLARTANGSALTRIVGTKGYMAPECLDVGPITPKVDVFAFGVLLLELITDKYPIFVQDGRERLLSTAIAAIMESPNAETELSCFVAPGLSENGGLEHAIQVVMLSLSCLRQDPEDRPDMVEVVSVLLKVQLNIHKRARAIGTKTELSMDDQIC